MFSNPVLFKLGGKNNGSTFYSGSIWLPVFGKTLFQFSIWKHHLQCCFLFGVIGHFLLLPVDFNVSNIFVGSGPFAETNRV